MDIRSTVCSVEIITPEGIQIDFRSDAPQGDMLRVETHADLSQACGSFILHLAPRLVEGKTWAQRIPLRSLVTIRMDRPGLSDMPETNPVVMVGLTDDHVTSENWQQAQPARSVQIAGRGMSCILIDAVLWFHPLLRQQGGVLSPLEAQLGAQGLELTWNPDLMRSGVTPQKNLISILEYFLFGGNTAANTGNTRQQSVINLHFPNRNLTDLLKINNAQWNTFDQVNVAIGQNTAFVGSIYNYLQVAIDPAFQEFFARVEDGVTKLHFRGKPFKHEDVSKGTRFKTDPTLKTIKLQKTWIRNQQMRRSSQAVYNVFWVLPMGSWHLLESAGFNYVAKPALAEGANHPSSLERYGLRVMKVASPYLPAMHAQKPQTTGLLGSPSQETTITTTGTPQSNSSTAPSSARIPTESLSPEKAALATQAAQIAQQQGVPQSMIPSFLANIQAESDWNPDAKNPNSGASGLLQFMPATAAEYGVTNPFDPVQAMTGGAQYWRALTAMFGQDPSLVTAAYNAGPAVVKHYNGVPPFAETQQHVARVNRLMPKYTSATPVSPQQNQQQHAQPSGRATETPPPLAGSIGALAEKWSKVLRAWYQHATWLDVGIITVIGHPGWNFGHRLLIEEDGWEAYIEGVSHLYDGQSGEYTTQLRFTRGWRLDGQVEGKTQRE